MEDVPASGTSTNIPESRLVFSAPGTSSVPFRTRSIGRVMEDVAESNREMTELRFTVLFFEGLSALGTRGETGVGVGVLTLCRGERVGGVRGRGKGL